MEEDANKAYNRARLSAMNMLSRREQSSVELRNKLSARFDSEIVEEVLKDLIAEGLQSDERFLESFVRSKVNRGQGPLKISQDLRQKGIASEAISKALAVYSEEWLSLAQEALERKFGDSLPEDFKEKQKRQRFVACRGFPMEICYKLFDH